MERAETRPDYTELYARLGYRRLNRTWAKLEILFGLGAAGIGLFLGDWWLTNSARSLEWAPLAGALALFVLGGYLAMAGHRSHLYQSNNELTAHILGEIHRLKEKG